jgi:hypothetical protein
LPYLRFEHIEIVPKTATLVQDFQKAAVGTFAALNIATSTVTNVLPANAYNVPPAFTSSTMVAEKVIREGVYGEYSVDVQPQKYDDARSTYKSATETKSKKGKLTYSIITLSLFDKLTFSHCFLLRQGKYTALLAILIVGSFIIPMAQYFWYVRDDDSSDRFFAQKVPPPPPKPPAKKKWF